ncbi:TPR-like protein [Lichtheimia hyalospora FSU 10163]|nr:TPR-like protein [Lichtheimia hyalospora FSU 10163]
MNNNTDETFNKGVDYRLAGNEAFKKADFPEALKNYHHALLHLRTLGGTNPPAELKKKTDEELVKIYNNMAAVLAKQDKWDRVLKNAIEANKLDESNIKAKFRMGQAYGRLGNADKAIELLNEVKQKNPTDELVKHELTRIKQEEKKGQDQVKSTYWGMFDRKPSGSSSKQTKT